jgi:hypothetical protein
MFIIKLRQGQIPHVGHSGEEIRLRTYDDATKSDREG